MLSVGDFDERIFLGDDSSVEIGTPAKSGVSTGDLAERMQVKRIQQSFEPVSCLDIQFMKSDQVKLRNINTPWRSSLNLLRAIHGSR